MTVRAYDLALRDLRDDRLPRLDAEYECAHIRRLDAADVIEVEHDGIRFSAVDAWMRAEVLEEQGAIALQKSAPTLANPLTAQNGIVRVDSDLAGDVARPAAGLSAIAALGLAVELLKGLPHLADGAHLAGYGGMIEQRHVPPRGW